ncbi:hypothetical protein D3C81_2151710 [compost metagenome]
MLLRDSAAADTSSIEAFCSSAEAATFCVLAADCREICAICSIDSVIVTALCVTCSNISDMFLDPSVNRSTEFAISWNVSPVLCTN